MSLDWTTRPDDAKVIQLVATVTPDGLPCQVIATVEFYETQTPVGRKDMAISPGWIATYFPQLTPEQREAKFLELYNAVPQVPQSILDAVTAQVPKAAFRDIW